MNQIVHRKRGQIHEYENYPRLKCREMPRRLDSGDDPMTGAQASYLQTLCEQAHCPEAFDADLTKAEASKLIDEMRQKTGLAG